ncbi:molybdenum cofactor biosynthesis protein C [Thermohalobacter berrensis]|uniref:Cyclic pyranopterin monophosphate synthase n=2 Tax=Thermohalobacter berrensis TaxID=99594 RepID=A0A419T2K7_9FIRM|nr:molybdenum cofactor biosynthesis protein C [Thermohalobacter berrensis]
MGFTHLNENGRAHMVEVGDKNDTKRTAIAKGKIKMKKGTIKKIKEGVIKKGDVLSVAQIGGIMGAKKTSDIIPMCHNIPITGANIKFNILDDCIEIEAEVKTVGKTGVEMEALNAVSITALTIYDMCKSVDKDMIISDIMLIKKTGGKSGTYLRGNKMAKKGKVVAVNISEKKGVPKKSIEEGFFKEGHGLVGDAHAGKWHRQVSLLGVESVEKMKKLGIKGLCSGKFAENLTTEGIYLHELSVGTKLKIGETIQEISQIGKECHSGCAIAKEVGKCIMPKEGIFTRVIKGGKIKVGDTIEVLEDKK